jgi:ribosomal-protein-alanine N-acetyltransferase
VSATPAPLVPLRREELAEVAAIERQVFPEPLSLVELETLYDQPGTVYVGFHDDGRLAAYFGFQVVHATAHVISNATHPDHRRRGYGTRVLREAEPIARALGARWYLGQVRRSNAAQRRILARLGWREIGLCPRFFGNGEDAYVVFRLFDEEAPGHGDGR